MQICFLTDVLLPPEILANWLQPGALVAGAVGGMGLLIGAFRSLRGELKNEMRAGEDRVNKRIDEVKGELAAATGRDALLDQHLTDCVPVLPLI